MEDTHPRFFGRRKLTFFPYNADSRLPRDTRTRSQPGVRSLHTCSTCNEKGDMKEKRIKDSSIIEHQTGKKKAEYECQLYYSAHAKQAHYHVCHGSLAGGKQSRLAWSKALLNCRRLLAPSALPRVATVGIEESEHSPHRAGKKISPSPSSRNRTSDLRIPAGTATTVLRSTS